MLAALVAGRDICQNSRCGGQGPRVGASVLLGLHPWDAALRHAPPPPTPLYVLLSQEEGQMTLGAFFFFFKLPICLAVLGLTYSTRDL